MKTQLTLTALALTLLTSSAFALPSGAPFPLVGEHQDSQIQQQPLMPVAENGSERTPGAQHVQVAEGGYERTPGAQHVQVAEGGYERTLGAEHVQIAEGGSDRLLEQRAHNV